MKKKLIVKLSLTIFIIFFLTSCSFIEMSGTKTRETGESMEDYSKQHDGFLGKMAGFGGKVNKSVGSAIENVAKRGEKDEPGETKTDEFVEANKTVMNSEGNAANGRAADEKETLIKAQKRLEELGYEPGPVDGIMGKKTRTAIAQYQQSSGLKITKELDKDTMISLEIE